MHGLISILFCFIKNKQKPKPTLIRTQSLKNTTNIMCQMWFPRVPILVPVLALPAMKKIWFVRVIPCGACEWVRNFPRLFMTKQGKLLSLRERSHGTYTRKCILRWLQWYTWLWDCVELSLKSYRQSWYKSPHFSFYMLAQPHCF